LQTEIKSSPTWVWNIGKGEAGSCAFYRMKYLFQKVLIIQKIKPITKFIAISSHSKWNASTAFMSVNNEQFLGNGKN